MKQLDSVQKLLNSVALLCERRLHRQADIAPRFNLFRILGVEEKEVSTHSAFLAHLLNPSEGHAQGDLFLRQFLLEIGHEQLASFDGWIISKEVPIVGGRLDIVLQSAKASAIIVVENKIGTEDHATQLPAYRRWLDAASQKVLQDSAITLSHTNRRPGQKGPPKHLQADFLFGRYH
jgi:PD-(D/E)XK nuclease superfamily